MKGERERERENNLSMWADGKSPLEIMVGCTYDKDETLKRHASVFLAIDNIF